LERHGIVTRSGVLADGLPGGFAGIYRALGEIETLGRTRRGYFLAGMGGAQFALPGAVERLRDMRDPPEGEPTALVIGAADPAQPYGASVPWPARTDARGPSRTFGAQVVLVDGEVVAYLERGGKRLLVLSTFEDPRVAVALQRLADWIRAVRTRKVAIERVNGESVFGTPIQATLIGVGFTTGLRALELRGDDAPRAARA
jgi:ATP-dependent Lhr-like helicase